MPFKKNPEANRLIHVTFTPLFFFFLFKSNFITIIIKSNASSCIAIFTRHFGPVNAVWLAQCTPSSPSDWHSAY